MFRMLLARILYMWGSLHRNFGNKISYLPEHRAAVYRFSQAYDMDPNLRRARLDRGIVLYREMGHLEEAIADFDALLAEDPVYGPALLNRAMAAQQLGDYSGALADLEAYLKLPMEDEEYWDIATRTAALLRDISAELTSTVDEGEVSST
jgi:tetratricopeptide (TPR) repeat protein